MYAYFRLFTRLVHTRLGHVVRFSNHSGLATAYVCSSLTWWALSVFASRATLACALVLPIVTASSVTESSVLLLSSHVIRVRCGQGRSNTMHMLWFLTPALLPAPLSLQGPPPPPSARPATPGPTLPPQVEDGRGRGDGTVGSQVEVRAWHRVLRETTEIPEYDILRVQGLLPLANASSSMLWHT